MISSCGIDDDAALEDMLQFIATEQMRSSAAAAAVTDIGTPPLLMPSPMSPAASVGSPSAHQAPNIGVSDHQSQSQSPQLYPNHHDSLLLSLSTISDTSSLPVLLDASSSLSWLEHHDDDDADWLRKISEAVEDVTRTIQPYSGPTFEILPPSFAPLYQTLQVSLALQSQPLLETPHSDTPRPSLLSYSIYGWASRYKEIGHCMTCGRELAVMFFHGADKDALDQPRVTDITCYACSESRKESPSPFIVIRAFHETSHTFDNDRWKKGKRKHLGQEAKVWCDCCRHLLGYGGVRLIDSSQARDSGGWISPSFDVDYVCSTCVVDFNICIKCAGGSRHRRGTWRPRQFFEKTICFGSHETMGVNDKVSWRFVTYRTPALASEAETWNLVPSCHFLPPGVVAGEGIPNIKTPAELLERFLLAREQLWVKFSIEAFFMRSNVNLWTWDMVCKEIAKGTRSRQQFIMGQADHTRSRNVRRYITLAFRPKPFARGRLSPLSKLLGTEGISMMTQHSHGVGGLSTSEWYVDERHVFLGDCHVLFDRHGDLFRGVSLSHFERITFDCRESNLPPPEFLWHRVGKRTSDANKTESEKEFPPFLNIVKYCDKFGRKVEDMRALCTIESLDDDDDFDVFLLRWTDRDVLGTM